MNLPASEAELRLAAIIASSDDAIFSKNLDSVITSWNRSAERIFGYTAAEVIGQSAHLIVPADRFEQEEDIMRRITAGQNVEHHETSRVRKDGSRIDVSMTVSPLCAANGAVVGASVIARDVTFLKKLERDALHFAAIVESSDDAIVSKDLNGTVMSWNPAAEQLFGYTADEMLGKSIRVIVPDDRQLEEDYVLVSVRRGDAVNHFETVRKRKDGSLVPISLTVSPIRGLHGEIVGASKIARDLTRVQTAQGDARRLAAIVDSSDDAIVSKDLNSTIMTWNAAAERIFGFTSEEMVGRSIRTLIPQDRQDEEDEVLGKIRRGERVEHYETLRLRKDGSLIPVSLTVSPIRNQDGEIVGASKIARDVSERVKAEEERQRLLAVARDASRLKDEFLATLSHELRTPLNAIVGYLRLMEAGIVTGDKLTHAIETVSRNASSLTQIVEDVLDVSRIVAGKLRLNVQAVDLGAIIHDAIETVRPAIDAKDIRVAVIIDPRAGPVSGDPERLRQVLWNLCANAAKFTPRGGRVEVRLERVNSHIELSVSDSGIGISREFLPYLFERFTQADAGMTRAHGGLGLGLAISRHLIELQGGRIWAFSEGEGKGSTFRIDLPIRSVATGTETVDGEHPHAPKIGGPMHVPDLKGAVILVVDDEPDALALSKEILEATGARVYGASSGAEALTMIEAHQPEAVIADLGMPSMSGFELIERIRRSENTATRDIAAAALTAFARSDDRARSLRSGFELHLAKPIDPTELMAAASALVRQARSRGGH